MNSYTRGPWHVRLCDPPRRYDDHCAGIFGPDGEEIVVTDSGYYPPSLADAYLIAAAPAMLIALRAIRESCPCDNDVTREFNAAWGLLEAAIFQAEHETD